MTKSISLQELLQHQNNYDGVCTHCGLWTAGGVEPDADDYECEACGEHTVVGAELAFVRDDIEVEGD